ncbi:MAG: hypothetical protein AVDCRST_MAG33-3378 [uncultured Thermomicrobiales bacterium]|uniref:Uncharacterized protein n=1 Tax=uncultured Thermomicrobiales bacterium TaxID=1645740 RepID=A0A6J4VKL6_9BACT|nr:MAG: hypothetical protein AVDCRST_MAG33-3378 [uncultured Thermomicrobiales bacterium]
MLVGRRPRDDPPATTQEDRVGSGADGQLRRHVRSPYGRRLTGPDPDLIIASRGRLPSRKRSRPPSACRSP